MFTLLTTPSGEAKLASSSAGFAAWISQRVRKLTVTGLLVGLVACSVIALSSRSAVAHPPPPGIFGCAHTHGLAGNCILDAPGGACVRPNGQPGICKIFGSGGRFCACVDDRGSGSLIAGLPMMKETVEIALESKKAGSTVGRDAVCAQNQALATNFMVSHDAIRSLDPSDRQLYAPELLQQVDFVATNLKKFASALRPCGITIPTDTIADTLRKTKLDISSSAESFLGLQDCNLGDFSGLDGVTCSANTPGCGISTLGIGVDTASCQVNINPFGSNGLVAFTPTGNPSEVSANGLDIQGNPNHDCTLTASVNGSIDIIGGCSGPTSCTHSFTCF